MGVNLNVDIRRLSRVEGHGDIVIRVENGKLKQARWDTVETPRFFEVMFKNKHYTTVGPLAARICGICSISHCLGSLRATEKAFKVTVPHTASRLRLLAKHGETLQSHVLHLLFLAAPDFFNEPSVIHLIEKKPALITVATRLKGLANRLCDTVAGRTTHPVAFQVGGVAMVPSKDQLSGLQDEFKRALNDLEMVAEWFSTVAVPDFTRETEFVSLKGDGTGYPFIGGTLVSSDGIEKKEQEYLSMTNEYVDINNTSKWTRLSRESYAVGALARYNNNAGTLHPKAVAVALQFGLKPVCHNPFMNNVAQLVECFHVVHESICLMDELLDSRRTETMGEVSPKAGEGVSAVEAPRGILFHHYRYDDAGRIEMANCVVPTTQNNANIHLDLKRLVQEAAKMKGMSDKTLEALSATLVRSYDPCISCSVH